jgi:4-hydroxythreonine-4-phosphate dehydrogenase
MADGTHKHLVITLGDPFSVNVELVGRCLSGNPSVQVTLVGSHWHWQNQVDRTPLKDVPIGKVRRVSERASPGIYFFDVGTEDERPADVLDVAARGDIATRSLYALRELDWNEDLAVITCPIDKEACQRAGFSYPGHTEYFMELWGRPNIMVLAGSKLRVGLVTNHLPLAKVSDALTSKLVVDKVSLFEDTLRRFLRIPKPRIALCGLNPHAGEKGMLGREDLDLILPAAHQAREAGILASGPHPADTIFYQALSGKYDGVLAMYHDQGLAPFKVVHFRDGVNISGGTPWLRISPDHGTASDLFAKDLADTGSFSECLTRALTFLGQEDACV